jgi:hypothetical protein
MIHPFRTIVRLSGRDRDPAPEQKSRGPDPRPVIRRFFATLLKLERTARPSDKETQHHDR